MSMREQVVRIKREDMDDGSSFVVINSIETDKVPLKADVVRAQMFKAFWLKPAEDNPNDLIWTDIANMDMKGSVPTRFINMMLTTMVSKMTKCIYDKMQEV